MEKKLKAMFDYQRFEGNKSLAALIRETEQRDCRELSEDELSFVNAAGDPNKEWLKLGMDFDGKD